MSGSTKDVLTLTRRAVGAVAARRFVGFDGAQNTVHGGKALGVSQHAAAHGTDCAVTVSGTATVEAAGAIAIGASVISNFEGRALPAGAIQIAPGGVAVTSTAANGGIVAGCDLPLFAMGDALSAAAGPGDLIEILLRR